MKDTCEIILDPLKVVEINSWYEYLIIYSQMLVPNLRVRASDNFKFKIDNPPYFNNEKEKEILRKQQLQEKHFFGAFAKYIFMRKYFLSLFNSIWALYLSVLLKNENFDLYLKTKISKKYSFSFFISFLFWSGLTAFLVLYIFSLIEINFLWFIVIVIVSFFSYFVFSFVKNIIIRKNIRKIGRRENPIIEVVKSNFIENVLIGSNGDKNITFEEKRKIIFQNFVNALKWHSFFWTFSLLISVVAIAISLWMFIDKNNDLNNFSFLYIFISAWIFFALDYLLYMIVFSITIKKLGYKIQKIDYFKILFLPILANSILKKYKSSFMTKEDRNEI
ncbi:hypothetical protein [Mycoplasmopsis pulmonis]|nr:hypothetical protein [Mycoplasmopsis pulmonis]MDZ7293118.1 hypothetical protein [Mycoplasmopsis pulmonis]